MLVSQWMPFDLPQCCFTNWIGAKGSDGAELSAHNVESRRASRETVPRNRTPPYEDFYWPGLHAMMRAAPFSDGLPHRGALTNIGCIAAIDALKCEPHIISFAMVEVAPNFSFLCRRRLLAAALDTVASVVTATGVAVHHLAHDAVPLVHRNSCKESQGLWRGVPSIAFRALWIPGDAARHSVTGPRCGTRA